MSRKKGSGVSKFEKIANEIAAENSEDEPGLLQVMVEWKDFHLFLCCCLGLIGLNGFVAAYFYATTTTTF